MKSQLKELFLRLELIVDKTAPPPPRPEISRLIVGWLSERTTDS